MTNFARAVLGTLLVLVTTAPLVAQPDELHLDVALNGVQYSANIGGTAGFDADMRAAFEAMLARHDARIEAAPWDIALRAARCRAIADSTYTFEYVEWVDELFDRYDECVAALEAAWPDHPEIVLLKLMNLSYEQQSEFAQPYIARLEQARWTSGQRARLYSMLAAAADYLGDGNAGMYAARALNADVNANTRLIYALSFDISSDADAVRQALLSPVERIDDQGLWQLASRMLLLSELGEGDAVVEIHDRLRDAEIFYNRRDAAAALIGVGEIERARAELAQYEEFEPWPTLDEFERFNFEYRHGTTEQALAAYNVWRDAGWSEDFLGVNRVALQFRDFSLSWQPRDWLFIAGFLLACAAVALVAALPVWLVQYRGLLVRSHSNRPYPSGGWQLRHAWMAMTVIGIGSVVALYFLAPIMLFSMDEEAVAMGSTDAQLALMALVESMLTLVFLLPLARFAAGVQSHIWVERWTLTKALMIGAAVAVVLRVPFFVMVGVLPELDVTNFTDDVLMQTMSALRETYGAAVAYWLVVLLAPVVEEFVFRGVLLEAFSRHIRPLAANALQALLFAAAHMSLTQLPLLFIVGFSAGVLARRSGGLAAPMAMHAVFNLVLAIYLL